MDFAEQLRQARGTAGLTQIQLATRAGTSQSRLSSYENGSVTPNRSTKVRLLRATHVRPSQIIEETRDEILEIAQENGIHNVRVFGSIARREDTVKSDIDLLVTPGPRASLLDISAFLEGVREVTGFNVDVISDRTLSMESELLREAVTL
ncbi:MAG: helix-turn-helix domain-containing protein [Acidimicrobiales bacterium]